MKEHIKEYRERLEKGLCDYMQTAVSERSAEAVYTMIKAYKKLDELEAMMEKSNGFTYKDAECWNEHMENADGTKGGHWNMEQTNAVAERIGLEFEHVTDCVWNVVMNMMYSDYYKVADKFGVNTPEFYADMAKAFLFDKDGGKPMEKVTEYYHNIVKANVHDEQY